MLARSWGGRSTVSVSAPCWREVELPSSSVLGAEIGGARRAPGCRVPAGDGCGGTRTDGGVEPRRSTASLAGSSTSTPRRSCVTCCTTSSAPAGARRPPRARVQPTLRCWRSCARDQHEIVDALLAWRGLDKLNSTYLEGPAQDGRRTRRQGAHDLEIRSRPRRDPRQLPTPTSRTCKSVRALSWDSRRSFIPGSPRPGAPLRAAELLQGLELRVLTHLSG